MDDTNKRRTVRKKRRGKTDGKLSLVVRILVISCICAHVPINPRARTSVPDDWLVIKVSESDTDLW